MKLYVYKAFGFTQTCHIVESLFRISKKKE